MARRSPPLAGTPMDGIGLALQPVLSERVNVLLKWARLKRPGWHRRDVVAALVYNSPRTLDELEALIERYEDATVDGARIKGQSTKTAERQPGRIPHDTGGRS